MSKLSRVLKVVALCVVGLLPAVALAADSDGLPGTIMSLRVNESSSDDYGSERGHVFIDEGGTSRKYQWGGLACNGRNLTAENTALLFDAMRDRGIEVFPYYKPANGGIRCLVGFELGLIDTAPY